MGGWACHGEAQRAKPGGLDILRSSTYLVASTDRLVGRLLEHDVVSTSTDRGDKRPRLVKAATDVFVQKGYAATRVADIAERAGIGKGTVYEYFSSKKELLFAVFESINEDITAIVLAMSAGRSDAEALEVACAAGTAAVASPFTRSAFSPLHHNFRGSAATEPFFPTTT